jgi:hypothetical protein
MGSNCGGIINASCAEVERFRTASSGFCIVANTEHCRSPIAAPVDKNQFNNVCITPHPNETKKQVSLEDVCCRTFHARRLANCLIKKHLHIM